MESNSQDDVQCPMDISTSVAPTDDHTLFQSQHPTPTGGDSPVLPPSFPPSPHQLTIQRPSPNMTSPTPDSVTSFKVESGASVGGLQQPEERKTPRRMGTCKVCGDEASGMYFGAIVCVPCKVSSSYLLASIAEKLIFKCVMTAHEAHSHKTQSSHGL